MKTKKMIAVITLGIVGTIGILFGCGESEKEKINRYIKEMGSKSKTPTRDSYMRQLVDMGQKAVDPLIDALENSSDQMIRAYSALALGNIGDKSAKTPLKRAFKDKDAEVRARAAEGLTELIKENAITDLIEMLKDEHATARESAQNCLVNLGEKSIDTMVESLSGDDATIRTQAKVVLERIGRKAVPQLTSLLETTSDSDVQIITARTLAAIGDKSVMPVIAKVRDKYTGQDEKSQKTRRSLQGTYRDLEQK
jgi:HEAT repeat protein